MRSATGSSSRREAEEHARARESVEQRLAREAEERATWEKLAQEIDGERAEIAARLAAVQAAAERAPKSEMDDLLERGEAASERFDLDEAATRALIDQQLRDAGWEADTNLLRYGIFYAQGVKTNVLFFQRGKTDKANTKDAPDNS